MVKTVILNPIVVERIRRDANRSATQDLETAGIILGRCTDDSTAEMDYAIPIYLKFKPYHRQNLFDKIYYTLLNKIKWIGIRPSVERVVRHYKEGLVTGVYHSHPPIHGSILGFTPRDLLGVETLQSEIYLLYDVQRDTFIGMNKQKESVNLVL